MAVVFKPNRRGIERLLDSPQGAVGADLLRRGLRVESQARVNASGRPGPNVDTGRLRSSIRTDLVEREGRVVCRVGAYTEYAAFVELGTDRAPAYPFLVPSLAAAQ